MAYDRVAHLLRRCKRALTDYAQLAHNGDWPEEESLRILLKDIEKALIYRSSFDAR